MLLKLDEIAFIPPIIAEDYTFLNPNLNKMTIWQNGDSMDYYPQPTETQGVKASQIGHFYTNLKNIDLIL